MDIDNTKQDKTHTELALTSELYVTETNDNKKSVIIVNIYLKDVMPYIKSYKKYLILKIFMIQWSIKFMIVK